MLYYCNMVRWAWLDRGLSGWLTTLLQCFDTVGWVIRPVKTVGRITYIVLVQTLNHAQSINHQSSSSHHHTLPEHVWISAQLSRSLCQTIGIICPSVLTVLKPAIGVLFVEMQLPQCYRCIWASTSGGYTHQVHTSCGHTWIQWMEQMSQIAWQTMRLWRSRSSLVMFYWDRTWRRWWYSIQQHFGPGSSICQ